MLKRKLKAEKLNDISIDVPVDWEIRKLEEVAREVSERGGTSAIPVLSMTKYDGFVPSLEYFKKRIFSRSTHNYKVVKKGQFAYSTIHLDEGAIGLLQEFEIGLISPMYTVFEADTSIIDLSFFEYKLSHDETIRIYGQLGQGSVDRRKSISFDKFKNIQIALPPILEQQRIAVILSSLDVLIQISSQVLKQLETVKRGMMQQLLTRGMPTKNRKFKPTELGEIPLEWEVKTLKDLGKWSGGGTPSKQKPKFWENGTIPWISPKDMYTREIVDAQDWITEEAVKASATNVYPVGSVLVVTRSGVLRHTLPIARLKRLAAVNQDLKVLVVNSNIDSKYVHYFLESSSAQILQACVKPGTTVESIETMLLLAFPIPLPSLEEQQRIVTILSSFDARIRLEKDYKTSLETLKKGLMQQLLSGKLDAREITILEGKT
jgi:type I restriction enzyme, S subunit